MYYSLTRYVALARARRDLSTLTEDAVKGLPPVTKTRSKRRWSPLENIYVPHCTATDGKATLDGTLDHLSYQLMRDSLLPSLVKGGTTAKGRKGSKALSQLEDRSVSLQREALARLEQRVEKDMRLSKGGIQVRRSIAETALVIGCDEAGRGPLAGPVVGAAVCRVPQSAFSKPPTSTNGKREETFAVADSKRMTDVQREKSFDVLTGSSNIFQLVNQSSTKLRIPMWGSSRKLAFHATQDEASIDKDIIQRATVSSEPTTLCFRGIGTDSMYRYHWGITIANHGVVDRDNIFASSMMCMHNAAEGVWRELEQPLGGEHGNISTSQLLYHLYSNLVPHDDEAELLKELDFVTSSPDDIFGAMSRQPPLVLVDGSHTPERSVEVFSDIEVGGAAHHVVKGDGRSWSIAAASNLAKVCRDSIMDQLHTQYPVYGFDGHRGYPVSSHLKLIKKHGLSPVHRRSYKPCIAVSKQDGSDTVDARSAVALDADPTMITATSDEKNVTQSTTNPKQRKSPRRDKNAASS